MVVRRAIKSKTIVAGGGATEVSFILFYFICIDSIFYIYVLFNRYFVINFYIFYI